MTTIQYPIYFWRPPALSPTERIYWGEKIFEVGKESFTRSLKKRLRSKSNTSFTIGEILREAEAQQNKKHLCSRYILACLFVIFFCALILVAIPHSQFLKFLFIKLFVVAVVILPISMGSLLWAYIEIDKWAQTLINEYLQDLSNKNPDISLTKLEIALDKLFQKFMKFIESYPTVKGLKDCLELPEWMGYDMQMAALSATYIFITLSVYSTQKGKYFLDSELYKEFSSIFIEKYLIIAHKYFSADLDEETLKKLKLSHVKENFQNCNRLMKVSIDRAIRAEKYPFSSLFLFLNQKVHLIEKELLNKKNAEEILENCYSTIFKDMCRNAQIIIYQ